MVSLRTDLATLSALQTEAYAEPPTPAWQARIATKEARDELAGWLASIAYRVAALGLRREARQILTVLPGVTVSAPLRQLVEEAADEADRLAWRVTADL